MLQQQDIYEALEKAATEAGIEDVHPLEIQFFLSAICSSIGISAVDVARKTGECLKLHSRLGNLDFDELPRKRIQRNVEAATGLPSFACAHMLGELSKFIARSEETDIWILGSIEKWGNSTNGYTLILSDTLKISPKAPAT